MVNMRKRFADFEGPTILVLGVIAIIVAIFSSVGKYTAMDAVLGLTLFLILLIIITKRGKFLLFDIVLSSAISLCLLLILGWIIEPLYNNSNLSWHFGNFLLIPWLIIFFITLIAIIGFRLVKRLKK